MTDPSSVSTPADHSSSASGERRSRLRYPAGGVSGILPGAMPLEIVDVSEVGLAVATGERLQMNRSYNVTVQYRRKQIEVSAEVVWCRLAETRQTKPGDFAPWYHAGLVFPQQFNGAGHQLLATLKNLWITTVPTRTFGSAEFQPRATSSFARVTAEIQVGKISQRGLAGLIYLEPEPFTRIHLDIPLGNKIQGAGSTRSRLSVEGRITDFAELTAEGSYKVGVEFRRVSQNSRKVLADFMEERMSSGSYSRRAS